MDSVLQSTLLPHFGNLSTRRFSLAHLNMGNAFGLPSKIQLETYGYYLHPCADQGRRSWLHIYSGDLS